jgi:hypothetical protein
MLDRILRTKLDGPGLFLFEVAGRNHYQGAIQQLLRNRYEESSSLLPSSESAEYFAEATLRSEPTNPHDSNAIVVEISGLQVGYLNRQTAAKLTAQAKRLGFERIEATCRAKLTGYRSHSDQTANVTVMLDYYTNEMKRSESVEKPVDRFEFQVEYPRFDLDPNCAFVGANLKFWINPSRPNHVLIYPPYDTHYTDPHTPLGSVPSTYVLAIVRNINSRGYYSARLAARLDNGWLVDVELTSKQEFDRRIEESTRARVGNIGQLIQKPYKPQKPVQVTFELPAMALKKNERFVVIDTPSGEQIASTDETRLSADLLHERTKNTINVDLPVEFLIKVKRLLINHQEIILTVREIRKNRSGGPIWCDAEINHLNIGGGKRMD